MRDIAASGRINDVFLYLEKNLPVIMRERLCLADLQKILMELTVIKLTCLQIAGK